MVCNQLIFVVLAAELEKKKKISADIHVEM